MFQSYVVEICAGGIEDVKTASRFPVDRIELNSALELGGLTPSLSTLIQAKQITDIPLMCMARCRGAGFNYSEAEYEIIREDAKLLLEHGADGIVFGFLNPDHTVNIPRTRQLVQLIHSYNKTAVFHRAFDLVQDPRGAVETLIDLHVDRVLTSGLAKNACEGSALIHSLIDSYGRQIDILPGCGITANNIVEVLKNTGSTCFHMSAKSSRNDEGTYAAVDSRNIQSVMQKLQAAEPLKSSLLTREDEELMIQEWFEKERL